MNSECLLMIPKSLLDLFILVKCQFRRALDVYRICNRMLIQLSFGELGRGTERPLESFANKYHGP